MATTIIQGHREVNYRQRGASQLRSIHAEPDPADADIRRYI
jgi:hypothetical protein